MPRGLSDPSFELVRPVESMISILTFVLELNQYSSIRGCSMISPLSSTPKSFFEIYTIGSIDLYCT
jgi:hypothetical protein